MGICPAVKTNPPALIACEYTPIAWGASLVATPFFSSVKLRVVIRATTNNSNGHFFMLAPCGDRVVRDSTDHERAQKPAAMLGGAAMGSQRRQHADQKGRGKRVISTRLSPRHSAGPEGVESRRSF